jgi:hypothetical protein
MQAEETFGVIALVALTLAGFTGVIMTGQSSVKKWALNNLYATALIFEHTFAIAFLALLPVPLASTLIHNGGSTAALWRVASTVFAIAMCVLAGAQKYRIDTQRKKGIEPRRKGSFTFAYFPISMAIIVAQVLNAVQWNSPSAYLWSLVTLLFAPGVQFWFLVQYAIDGIQGGRRGRSRNGADSSVAPVPRIPRTPQQPTQHRSPLRTRKVHTKPK